jgi:hypothetical protein
MGELASNDERAKRLTTMPEIAVMAAVTCLGRCGRFRFAAWLLATAARFVFRAGCCCGWRAASPRRFS